MCFGMRTNDRCVSDMLCMVRAIVGLLRVNWSRCQAMWLSATCVRPTALNLGLRAASLASKAVAGA